MVVILAVTCPVVPICESPWVSQAAIVDGIASDQHGGKIVIASQGILVSGGKSGLFGGTVRDNGLDVAFTVPSQAHAHIKDVVGIDGIEKIAAAALILPHEAIRLQPGQRRGIAPVVSILMPVIPVPLPVNAHFIVDHVVKAVHNRIEIVVVRLRTVVVIVRSVGLHVTSRIVGQRIFLDIEVVTLLSGYKWNRFSCLE